MMFERQKFDKVEAAPDFSESEYRNFVSNTIVFFNGKAPMNLDLGSLNGIAIKGEDELEGVTVKYNETNPLHQVYLSYMHDPACSNKIALKVSSLSNGKIPHTAYFLPWSAGHAFVILLQDKADLFFTPQLNGCSLLVFDSPNGLAVVHYNNNNQVPDVNQTFWQKWIDRESHEAHVARTEEIQLKARAVGSHAFADSFSGIANDKYGSAVGGAHLHSYHYAPEGGTAVAFGIRQGGKWHIYVQQKIANSASTKLLYTQQ